jgi:hypothetical protein
MQSRYDLLLLPNSQLGLYPTLLDRYTDFLAKKNRTSQNCQPHH